MKSKRYLSLIALATPLFLTGCNLNATSSSSAISSSPEVTTSSTSTSQATSSSSASSSSSSASSSALSKYDLAALKASYGDGSITQTKNGMEVVSDTTNSTYKLGLSEKKATYTLSGYIDWSIAVSNLGNLETISKGCTLVFNNACLVNDTDSPAISYLVDAKAITIQAEEGTTNYIFNVGSGSSIYSEHTIEIEGAGALTIDSLGANAVWGEEVRLYNSPSLTVRAGLDGFYGQKFITNDDNGDDSTYYTGTLNMEDIGKIAFDFSAGTGTEADPYSGSIDVGKGAIINVDGATNLAKTDLSLSIEGSLIATNISSSNPIITKNEGKCAITVATDAILKVNGNAIASKTI